MHDLDFAYLILLRKKKKKCLKNRDLRNRLPPYHKLTDFHEGTDEFYEGHDINKVRESKNEIQFLRHLIELIPNIHDTRRTVMTLRVSQQTCATADIRRDTFSGHIF